MNRAAISSTTPKAWWNGLTPSQRRAALNKADPEALERFSSVIAQNWDALPLAAMLTTQECFERLRRSA